MVCSDAYSRNVLLTGPGWRGGIGNISHDAKGPRPAGRIEKSKEGPDHATTGRRGDRPERAACAPAVEAAKGQGGQGVSTCPARAAVQPQAGQEDQAKSGGDTGPRSLSRLRSHAGGRVPGQQPRHTCRSRDGAELDDRRQAVACQPAAGRHDPSVETTPVTRGRVGAVGYQRACLARGSRSEALPDPS